MLVLFYTSAIILGQTKLTGVILDETGLPLPGASVIVKGTSDGDSTNFDGKFSIETNENEGKIIISFIGYLDREVTFSKVGDLGKLKLAVDQNQLDEVVIMANSIAIDRKTPVAVSTLKAAEIERKLGTQEFPEILKSTPGVYATRRGGGFGDGELRMRGFASENIGVLINGVPVNDMENGRVFWSNWAGLGDVTSSIQTQRGLGASKVAVPSVGGTVNIVTKTTDAKKGGSIIAATGNNGYQKYGATLSTGKMDNGLAATALIAKISGDGYVDATPFEAISYFGSLAYEINDKHTIALTSFGTPQEHGQRFVRSPIDDYRNAPSGVRYNPEVAIRNGESFLISKNFFHKNQTSLNHYWNVNDDTQVSTVVYFSRGTGGVSFDRDDTDGDIFSTTEGLEQLRAGNEYDPLNFDLVVDYNKANGESEVILNSLRNNHTWYGGLSTFKTKINGNLDFFAGLDYRHYTGMHFGEVADLLGGNFYSDDNDVNNPNKRAVVGDKILFNNDGVVNWFGGFVQLEYSNEKIDAFITSQTSNVSYKRIDYFEHLAGDPLRETDKFNFVGFGAKGGANYKIDNVQNVFGNVGYFERVPFFRAVFLDNSNTSVNEDAANEKVFSVELGYGIRSTKFSANLNAYRTEWNDRTLSRGGFQNQLGEPLRLSVEGINALHQGVEFDFAWKPTNKLSFTGMASFGDWKWTSNILQGRLVDSSQEVIGIVNAPLKGLRVSDAAQTTAALGLFYKFWDKTSITVDSNYFGNLHASADVTNDVVITTRNIGETVEDLLARSIENEDSVTVPDDTWRFPNYITFDASFRHGFNLGTFDTTVTLRVNNVLNTEYISDAFGNTGGDQNDALVYFGAGRTFNLGAKIKF